MRLLHTADWHLNDRLGGQDRTGHLRQRVERIAALCEEERIDVIALAGDVFSEQAKPDQIAESLRHLRVTFQPFFQRGGTIVAITGNHDQDGRIRPHLDVARAGMDLAEPPRQPGELFTPGKMYLVDTLFFGRVRGSDGLEVQLALLPFPSPSRLWIGDRRPASPEELNRPIARRVAAWIAGLRHEPGFDPKLRTVLMAHLTVRGCELSGGRFALTEHYDVISDPDDLPITWDYVALGHIHKPQMLKNQSHLRYCGSLDRLDFAEQNEDKGVVIVELGPEGRRGEPRFVSIRPTLLIDVHVREVGCTPAQVRAQVPDPEASLVRVTVEAAAATEGTGLIERMIEQSLPRECVTGVSWEAPAPSAAQGATFQAEPGVRETVLKYLQDKVPLESQRTALTELVATYLDEEEPS
jgi:exonuclease SbcD